MKRIIFFCLFIGLSAIQAEAAWDNIFGNMTEVAIPHISSFANENGSAVSELLLDVRDNAKNITIKYNGLLSASVSMSESQIKNDIESALQRMGTWVSLSSFTKSTSSGSMTFSLSIDSEDLPIRFKTGDGSVLKLGIVPSSFDLTVDKTEALPFEDIVFSSSNIRYGREYALDVVYASTGDPDRLLFRCKRAEFMADDFVLRTAMTGAAEYRLVLEDSYLADGSTVESDICEVSLAWPFYSLVESGSDDNTISNDGCSRTVIRKFKQPEDEPFSIKQQYIMEKVCSMFGDNKYNWLNPGLQVTPTYDAVNHEYTLKISAAPNASSDPVFYNLALSDSGTWVYQDGGFEVNESDIRGEKITDPYVRYQIIVDNAQKGVEYQLCKDYMALRREVCEENGQFIFDNIHENGVYTIIAVCSGTEWYMPGEVVISDLVDHSFNPAYTHNFQITHTYVAPDVKNTNVAYMDGMGRLLQSIDVDATPDGNDIVSFAEYDKMGRSDSKVYMPFVGTQHGLMYHEPDPTYWYDFSSELAHMQESYWSSQVGWDGMYAYTEKEYDNSPLGFVLSEKSPGQNGYWHPVEYKHEFNRADEGIKKFEFQEGKSYFLYLRDYGDNELIVTRSYKTESNYATPITSEYTDSNGRLVARRVQYDDNDIQTTYFVYDTFGRQRYVIPHMGAEEIEINDSFDYRNNKYSYYKEYDRFGNVKKQSVPGTEETVSIYDNRGRLVLSQSGNLRADKQSPKWFFTKYDEYDRPVMTGILTGGTYQQHLSAVQSQTRFGEERGNAIHGYTNHCYPSDITDDDILTVTYYDDYDWLSDSKYDFVPQAALDQQYSLDITSFVTGSKSKVLGEDQWLTSVIYYDEKYNVIQKVRDLYPSGKEIVANKYNWGGRVEQTALTQVTDAGTYEYNKWFDFDRQGRLLAVKQAITGDPRGVVTIASYEYDDMGQLISKSVHDGIDETHYEYALPGKLIASTSDNFSYRLEFDYEVLEDIAPEDIRYTGNIARVSWTNNDGEEWAYRYQYDNASQMVSAKLFEKTNGAWTETSKFTENGLSYDQNGNILSVKRSDGLGNQMHDIQYTYFGNQLMSLKFNNSTLVDTFTYDDNGNMTYDPLKKVTLKYNLLDLPDEILNENNEKVSYIYSASGEKLATDVGGSLTYYRNAMVYSKPKGGTEQLLHVMHPEGIVQYNNANSEYTYKYFKHDNVGSTRAVLSAIWDSGTNSYSMNVEQTTDYYPFGLAHELNDLGVNKYLYSGKELQDANIGSEPLGLYDFGSRYYNPVLCRWFNIDPAKQFVNPYLYCANSPMMFSDPNGEFAWVPFLMMAYATGVNANAEYNRQNGTNPFNPANWNWKSPSTYLGMVNIAGAAGMKIPSVNVPGAIPNAVMQAGINVVFSGVENIVADIPFFKGWGLPAFSGITSGAPTGKAYAEFKEEVDMQAQANSKVRASGSGGYREVHFSGSTYVLFDMIVVEATTLPDGSVRSDGKWFARLRKAWNSMGGNLDHLRTMQNPIVRVVHAAHKDYLITAGRVACTSLEYAGDVSSYAGLALSATGAGASVGAPLYFAGGKISSVGALGNIGLDMIETGKLSPRNRARLAFGVSLHALGHLGKYVPGQEMKMDVIMSIPSKLVDWGIQTSGQ